MSSPHGRIAIVGAGPAGCYLAQALLKAEPRLAVDLLDALPVPFGLLRYGVAADHQGTKGVARQFGRLFERQGARFLGNLRLGTDVSLAELRSAYDAVVLAVGLSRDRALGVPGEVLDGVIGAGALTRALYEHPDAGPLPLLGPEPILIGNGNVAIDVLRLLAKSPAELDGTDLGAGPTRWLAAQEVRRVTIVGRSPAAAAKFDPAMIRELARLGRADIRIDMTAGNGADVSGGPGEALAAIDGLATGPVALRFRFGLTPVAVEGLRRVAAVRFAGAVGEETIPCTGVVTAIGFERDSAAAFEGLPEEPADLANGEIAEGLYAAGWFRRGPRGTIPDARADAQVLARRILDRFSPDPSRRGGGALAARAGIVDWAAWKRIDAHELAGARPGRCRAKIATRAELMTIALPESAR